MLMKYMLMLSCLLLLTATKGQVADKVFRGKIYTQHKEQPWAEAMAIQGDRILAVGSWQTIQPFVKDATEVIRLTDQQVIYPGFIDSHTHLVDGGFRLFSVQLRDCKTPQEFIGAIAAFARSLKPGEWITGGNWDHQNWKGEMPTRDWIDSVTARNPVAITRMDGHTLLANSLAMKLAGIDESIATVEGGEVLRENGRLSGLFKDNAKQLINDSIPPATDEQKERALGAAMDYLVAQGITTAVSLTGTGFGDYADVYKRAYDKGQLKLRIYAAQDMKKWRELEDEIKKEGRGNLYVKRGALKGFMDGSLGAHTAAFKKPFSDTPSDSGFMVIDEDELFQQMKGADAVGLQLIVHAIGDRSVSVFLDLVERLRKENGVKDRRIRMEHAQHVSQQDLMRFKALGVIASMQPYHAIDDGRWAEKVIGQERAKEAFAMKSMKDSGALLVFGSDWHVAPASPLLGTYAAVTRETIDGAHPDGWVPEQRIDVAASLKAYTLDAAYAIFEEANRGSLEKGKLADFVILDNNILEIQPAEIPQVQVMKTYVGGKAVYSK